MILRSLKFPAPLASHIERNYSTELLRNGKYKSVVGLEVHAQILSNSKLFSGAANDPAAPANQAVSLFDAAIPGTLPRLNRHCVESAVKTAVVLDCHLNQISTFDRKHYFYADSPAGYQITQQRLPLAVNGKISFFVSNVTNPYRKTSKIHQIQLEQDSGKSIHFPGTRTSLLDLNRAGVPLMEIVFEPDLSTGEEAASLLKELSLVLTRLGVCSCKAAAFRCDANISIHKPGEPFGVRSEIKNITSIRNVAKAIEYEISRQIELTECGQRVVNETRSWDDETDTTIRMRDKEVVQDYRFMPEPNLLPLNLNSVDLESIKLTIPEMPDSTRETLEKYDLPAQNVVVLVKHERLLNLFLRAVEAMKDDRAPRLASGLLKKEVLACCYRLKINVDDCSLSAENFIEIVDMHLNRVINSALADDIIAVLLENPSLSARKYVEENNRTLMTDPNELKTVCDFVIENYAKIVKKAKRGKPGEFEKVIKAVVKESQNRADPESAKKVLNDLLNLKSN